MTILAIASVLLGAITLDGVSGERLSARASFDANNVRVGDPIAVLDADLEFHHQIVELADSPITLETWSFLIKRQRGARLSLEREYPSTLDSVVDTM